MAIYESNEQVIESILSVYRHMDVQSLSKKYASNACFYSSVPNGVGCAIGCLIDEETARRWDDIGGMIDEAALEDPDGYAKWFGPEVDVEFLCDVQFDHDDAMSVEHFLDELEKY